MYRELDAAKIQETIDRLRQRILDRFPDSSLGQVAGELAQVAVEARARIERMRRPIIGLRVIVLLLLIGAADMLLVVPWNMRFGKVTTTLDFVQVLEPALGAAFFISAFVVFLLSLEMRIKRGRVVDALHELRALAHIVDMHQLTKDPMPPKGRADTASSPIRDLTPHELSRYLDYCTELLSLNAKIAALYVQDLKDSQAVAAVDEIEALCTGLSRKIWQKMVLLEPGTPA